MNSFFNQLIIEYLAPVMVILTMPWISKEIFMTLKKGRISISGLYSMGGIYFYRNKTPKIFYLIFTLSCFVYILILAMMILAILAWFEINLLK